MIAIYCQVITTKKKAPNDGSLGAFNQLYISTVSYPDGTSGRFLLSSTSLLNDDIKNHTIPRKSRSITL